MPNFNHVIVETIDIAETNGNNKLNTVIFCKENQGIYLQDNDGVKRYGTDIVINSLDSDLIKNPLSAYQGKVLKEKIETDNQNLYNKLFNMISSLAFDESIRSKTQANEISKLYELNDTKINISDIVNDLTSENINKPLSAAQGKILNERINYEIDTLNVNIQNAIDNYDIEISAIIYDELDKKVNYIDIINQFDDNISTENIDNNKVLGAKQGFLIHQKTLSNKQEIDKKINISDIVDNLVSGGDTDKLKPLSAYQGYELNRKIEELNNKVNSIIGKIRANE